MESEESQAPKRERYGLMKVWQRVKDIFEDRPRSPPEATTATTLAAVTTESSAPGESEPQPGSKSQPAATVQPPPIEVDDTIEASPATFEPTTQAPSGPPTTTQPDPQDEAQMRFSRVQAIFAKYNLELSAADWDMRPKQPYERVAKNIRMRVRYTCHNCSTTFGSDKVCAACQHRRCAQCPRYPPKKKQPRQKATDPNPAEGLPGPPCSNAQAICHECKTGFENSVQECPNCHHQICDRCLQEAIITLEQPFDNPVEPKVGEQRTTTPN
ncbi:hypothetical protein A1O1_02926 [Capronia coronata CBS 617.96]|uniref:RING-type domain-containing protein n=1 Tax=Capronia coronata CBS 617.96 TaxID=1182541 RepID=W9YXX2_9EURO|nr:uncharacterized protein A1O1_02926 [Capronia coronata CBS 617.96]EXJ94530.1 hypothetical protein A1O1_02926 [Capronia coronata CBS 617.96]